MWFCSFLAVRKLLDLGKIQVSSASSENIIKTRIFRAVSRIIESIFKKIFYELFSI